MILFAHTVCFHAYLHLWFRFLLMAEENRKGTKMFYLLCVCVCVCVYIYIYIDKKTRLSMTPVHRTVQEGLGMVSCREGKQSPSMKIWSKMFPLKNMLGLSYTFYIYISVHCHATILLRCTHKHQTTHKIQSTHEH